MKHPFLSLLLTLLLLSCQPGKKENTEQSGSDPNEIESVQSILTKVEAEYEAALQRVSGAVR